MLALSENIIVTGSYDGSLFICSLDLLSKKYNITFSQIGAHGERICYLSKTDNKQIISSSDDKTIKIWDILDGNKLKLNKVPSISSTRQFNRAIQEYEYMFNKYCVPGEFKGTPMVESKVNQLMTANVYNNVIQERTEKVSEFQNLIKQSLPFFDPVSVLVGDTSYNNVAMTGGFYGMFGGLNRLAELDGEDVLKEYDSLVSVFVLGDKEVKKERIMRLYDKNEFMAERMMREKDTERKRYHNSFCEGKWGDSRNYDISINSSILGIEETAEVLIDFIDKKRNK
jgi:hypothetical protein